MIKKILTYPTLFLLLHLSTVVGAVKSHPRVLVNQDDLNRITTAIRTNESAHDDFKLFLQNEKNITPTIPFQADLTTLHLLLNKIMKNSFLYLVGSKDSELRRIEGYATTPDWYMRNIEDDLVALMQTEHLQAIQYMGGLEGPGYAAKALAIAYDWGYDYFIDNNRITHLQLEVALAQWGKWYTSPNRYYGSVFENHAPWGAKTLAYIAAALGDNELFYGADTKIQASFLPDKNTEPIQADVNISAKGFFDQIMKAVNFVAAPNGGWHEGMSYFLAKEIPELLEYAEVICTYHHDDFYTKSIYTSPLFKNAGLFLSQMTTPDGMLQKIGDTGFKTARPSEFYVPGGHTYGDINNIGAGYIAGYFLRQLSNRLRETNALAEAQLVTFYADAYCFDFKDDIPHTESNINLLYSLLWRHYEDSSQISIDQLEKNPLLTPSIYFDQTGILISKNSGKEQQSTIVRFDANPYYFAGHQHFAAGNFTIFKGATLAIDGGRYINPKTPAGRHYADTIYRGPLSHNVVLFGDELVGQKSFQKQPNRAPYTLRQLDAFQDYGVGPDNVRTFFSQDHPDTWRCPWHVSSMTLNLTKLYNHLGMEKYSRQLLHLYSPDSNVPFTDFVITIDDISLNQPNSAHWQMHFRDNGKNVSQGDSVYVVVREEKIKPDVVQPDFGDWYKGQLFVKSLSPQASLSVADFTFPDSLCSDCWNGRVWEESTNILRFNSASTLDHKFITFLAPTRFDSLSDEKISAFSTTITTLNVGNRFFESVEIQHEPEKKLYVFIAKPQLAQQKEHHLIFRNITQGWMIFDGMSAGEWQVKFVDETGDILHSQKFKTENTSDRKTGVLVLSISQNYEGHGDITLSLTQR